MPPITRFSMAASAALLLMAVSGPAALAQDAPADAPATAAPAAAAPETPVDPNAVVATVGDAKITEKQLELARESFGSELAQVPEANKRSVLIDALVNMQLLANAAHDEGLDKGPDYDARLAFAELQTARNAYVEHAVVNGLTDEEVQKGYEDLIVKQHKPELEVHAKHILVDTKEKAEEIIKELNNGASFEELAKQSKDPSGQNGGDLGFFSHGQMVPEFEKAAFALKPGEMTQEPVQSKFGWHVIKVEETRMSEPPKLAQVETELRNYLMRQKFQTVLTDLRAKYPVSVEGAPEGAAPDAAPMEADPATPPADGSAGEGTGPKN